MDQETLRRLEFEKVKDMLAASCSSILGRELVEGLQPVSDRRFIQHWLDETTQARRVLDQAGLISVAGLRDIRPHLRRVGIGGVLDPAELLDIASTLRGARKLRIILMEGEDDWPWLAELASRLPQLPRLEQEIETTFDEKGEVADGATPELSRIRQQIRTTQSRIREKLDSIIRSPAYQKILQENIVTIRGDRYCVPIRQEYKGQFPGVVHDQSGSGATLFIEPMAVVEFNNKLRQLTREEEQEVRRILTRLTASVRESLSEIQDGMLSLARLDFALAKARLSIKMRGLAPDLREVRSFSLRQARHPLIGENVVPIDVHLGQGFTMLIVTGPNTGGKTVTLKTVGLLALMLQSGLHIPVGDGSEACIFEKILVDIGDEQSIEQSLSTFSSHMTNIIKILQNATSDSLVLLDELGAGTDPAEGAALARALLEHLHQRGIPTLATTHYSELKTFAYSQDGVENASVEFDPQSLRPTYRLLIGLPGRSNAFEIAGRLGLDREIIGQARSHLRGEDIQVDELIISLEQNQRVSEVERLRAEQEREQANQLRERLQEKVRRLEEERGRILAQAQDEAEGLIKAAQREVAELVGQLRKAQSGEVDRLAQQARSRLKSREEELNASREKYQTRVKESRPKPPALRPGMEVFVHSLQTKGTVLEPPKGDGQVLVQVGIMKVQLDPTDLEISQSEKKAKAPKGNATSLAKSKVGTATSELLLLGMTVDEAIEKVEKYLDDATLTGLTQARLVHGKGTGALRKGLHEYLAGHPLVHSFRLGESGEGGSGVTVISLEGD